MAVNNPAFHTPEGAVEFTSAGDILYGAELAKKGLKGGDVSGEEAWALAMGLMTAPSGKTYSKAADGADVAKRQTNKIQNILKQVDEQGLKSLGRAGSSEAIREVVGTADDARALFDHLRGDNPIGKRSNNVITAESKTGQGTVTFSAKSKSGPPTVYVYGIESGVEKIKFVQK